MIDHLVAAHSASRAQYGKLASRFETLDAVRRQLQDLRDLGEFVDQDDVIKSASHLVGKGLTPQGLAGLLADMPKEGQALASWVQGLWSRMVQREQQLAPMMQAAKFQMGTNALQLLAGQHVQQRVGELGQEAVNGMAGGEAAAPTTAEAPPPSDETSAADAAPPGASDGGQ